MTKLSVDEGDDGWRCRRSNRVAGAFAERTQPDRRDQVTAGLGDKVAFIAVVVKRTFALARADGQKTARISLSGSAGRLLAGAHEPGRAEPQRQLLVVDVLDRRTVHEKRVLATSVPFQSSVDDGFQELGRA